MANLAEGSEATPSAERGTLRRPIRRSVLLVTSLLVVILVASCSVYCRHLLDQTRSNTCSYRLKSIWLSLNNRHTLHGAFPSAYLCDEAGKPINSWRAEVIPDFWYNFRPGRSDYAGGEGYNYAEPWDGPKNSTLKLDKHECPEFQCASDEHGRPAITDYIAVVGPNTMWAGCEPVTAAADGSDRDKILIIEVVDSDILWMEPRDLTLDQALDGLERKSGVRIGSHHRDGVHYVTVGGEVRTLDRNIDRESLRKLLVRDSIDSANK
jgi:uncharacterized protein DUF1559